MKKLAKASIIVTCYNKEKYIAGMFDSILAQKWSNIEVVLVNDGSTDRTGNIIAEYEPKFKNRGFSVIVINQKNSGVITAAKNGLLACTGDYFCIVDADDKLDAEYVSLPVSTLEKYKEFDYTICNYKIFKGTEYKEAPKLSVVDGDKNMLKKYLLAVIFETVWLYMVRSSYLNKEIIKTIYNSYSKASHEPGFIIPLTAYNGKVKVIDKPLYIFHDLNDETRHSLHTKYKDICKHFSLDYRKEIKLSIASLPNKIVDSEQKKQLVLYSKFRLLLRMVIFCSHSNELAARFELKKRMIELLKLANSELQIEPPLKLNEIQFVYMLDEFAKVFPHIFLQDKISLKPAKRIICYGAMGKIAKQWLPFIQSRAKVQLILWDKNGDSKNIKMPDFKALRKNDTMFVLPKKENIVEDVKKELKRVKFENAFFTPKDWLTFLLLHK